MLPSRNIAGTDPYSRVSHKGSKMKDTSEFVEEMGQLLEALGPGRMAGRLMGHLLICEPECQTASQLAKALQASKGSISTISRMLIQGGFIKKIRIPGQRSAVYRLEAEAWPEIIRNKGQLMSVLASIAHQGLELMKNESPERKARLQMMAHFYDFMSIEFPALFDRWEEHLKRNKR